MKGFGEKHEQILEFISECISEGAPPTVREICEHLHIKSTSTAHKYLKELEDSGKITMGAGRNRNIRLTNGGGEHVLNIPVLGTVAAGMPILAIENIEGYVPYQSRNRSAADLFALRVQGESMIEAAILDGDVIIARKTPTAQNGEIVVAMVEDEATVKTYYKEKGHFRLQPENSSMEPIIVPDVSILGKVIAVVRSFE